MNSDTVRFYPFQEIKVAVDGLPTQIPTQMPTPEQIPIPEFNIILPVMVIIGLMFLLSGKKV
ncbi:MAG: PEF-CTERM sorting domain-containing protein [Methanosarcinales archaeon]